MTMPRTSGSARLAALAALLTPLVLFPACAADPAPKPLLPLDLSPAQNPTVSLKPSSAQVTAAPTDVGPAGVAVTIQPGTEDYPGVSLHPATPWDLHAYGHVTARLVNTGTQPLTVALRVDNAGPWQDNPWDTETVTLAPGEAGTVTTIFGDSYGHKPGYKLDSKAVSNLLLFTNKADAPESFRIDSIEAGGPAGETPPVAPEDVRVKPPQGNLLAGDVTLTPGAGAAWAGTGAGRHLHLDFPGGLPQTVVSVKPAVGRWDLRDDTEVRVAVRNAGAKPAWPRVRLDSNGGSSDWAGPPDPIPPGATADIVVPFVGTKPADPDDKSVGSHLTSDTVSAVSLTALGGPGTFEVTGARAAAPAAALPAWLGTRPPVPGAWTKTLDDEFNGPTLNRKVWDIYGENYWDKASHWSKDDVLLGHGAVALRYEKKTGPNDDAPGGKVTPYAAGYLHTYGLWAQRYGYFEARMKLPTAPGLWPAFWMMPDRGGNTPQWQRQDTANGGMEFDIMEHLDRWGPHRYNIAMHWDGYGKDHKSNGSDKIYVPPDRDGYLTCGLLWTPGEVTYYCQGRPVLHWKNPRIGQVPEILMFTIPQGGWDNDPVDDSRLPDQFVIDYVRVWQRPDLAGVGQTAASR